MMKMHRLAVVLVIAALCSTGCDLFGGSDDGSSTTTPTSPTSPTTPTVPATGDITAYIGQWQSSSTGAPASTVCNNIDWQITGVSGSTISGAFTATCADGFQITGNGTGTPTANQLNWTAVGTATNSGVSCPFSLSGTAAPQGTTALSISYTGSVCGLAVAGTETLDKI
jgi:hypothetical protein